MTSQMPTSGEVVTHPDVFLEVEFFVHESGKPAGALVPVPLRIRMLVLEKQRDDLRKHEVLERSDMDRALTS